jgi:hypothetical protein
VPRPVVAFAVWTLFVWGGRIRNAVSDDAGAGPIVLAATFVALAVLVLATRGGWRPVVALAGWTVAVWAVRAVDIALLSDHGAAFIAVHLVLAAVSVTLALWSARTVTRSARAPQPVGG